VGTGLLLLAVLLQGCSVGSLLGRGGVGTAVTESDATTTTGSTGTASFSLARSKPLDAYVVMGGNIKRCWFNPTDPLLPKHVYRADVSPDGGKVKITVHQRADLGRAGLTTYVIDFTQSGLATVITTQNLKMPPNLAAKMEFDLDRWRRGASNCSKQMPAVAAAPASTGAH
jgi:hypothetical protein